MFNILEESQKLSETIIQDRKELHKIPELGFDLPKTKAYVKKRLEEMGYSPQEIGKSGIVALAGGKKPGKVILLRADMDALPINEETGLSFASENGCMHACGHDTHTAMLLGAAKLLKDHEDEIEGTVKLLFQPAEEILSGAKDMVDAGVLENPHVDAAMMIHIISGLDSPTGIMAIGTTGAVYASCDWFRVDIQGKGGHGALPEDSISPINIACAINASIQEIISMGIPERAIMSVGEFHGGTAGNIIPDTAYIQGTIRTFNEKVRNTIKEKFVLAAESIAKSRGGSAKVTYFQSVPNNINDGEMRKFGFEVLREMLGESKVADLEVEMGGAFARVNGSEDFAYISEKVPSLVSFLFAGNKANGYSYMSHHPKSDFDENDFYIGTASYVKVALEWLKRQ